MKKENPNPVTERNTTQRDAFIAQLNSVGLAQTSEILLKQATNIDGLYDWSLDQEKKWKTAPVLQRTADTIQGNGPKQLKEAAESQEATLQQQIDLIRPYFINQTTPESARQMSIILLKTAYIAIHEKFGNSNPINVDISGGTMLSNGNMGNPVSGSSDVKQWFKNMMSIQATIFRIETTNSLEGFEPIKLFSHIGTDTRDRIRQLIK